MTIIMRKMKLRIVRLYLTNIRELVNIGRAFYIAGMATDYEKLYRDQRHALGEPTREIARFFDERSSSCRVLDIGCGQGRDALYIARLGHEVVGVDLSPSGIDQLREDTKNEDLLIEGVVADVVDYKPVGLFDVVLFDRTLHMLSVEDQLLVLKRCMEHVNNGGYILINDERKNLPPIEALILESRAPWVVQHKKRGFLFAHLLDQT